jgi:hypothetical protein
MEQRTFIVLIIDILVLTCLFLWWQSGKCSSSVEENSGGAPTTLKTSIPVSSPAPVPAPVPKLPKIPPKEPIASAPEFEYIKSVYGPSSEKGNTGEGLKSKDVSKMLSFNKDGKITNQPFLCCDSKFGNPAPNVPKQLTIFYKRKGRDFKVILQENQEVQGTLP